MSQGKLRLGTSSWTAKGWEEAFYPAGTKPSDYIAYYAIRPPRSSPILYEKGE